MKTICCSRSVAECLCPGPTPPRTPQISRKRVGNGACGPAALPNCSPHLNPCEPSCACPPLRPPFPPPCPPTQPQQHVSCLLPTNGGALQMQMNNGGGCYGGAQPLAFLMPPQSGACGAVTPSSTSCYSPSALTCAAGSRCLPGGVPAVCPSQSAFAQQTPPQVQCQPQQMQCQQQVPQQCQPQQVQYQQQVPQQCHPQQLQCQQQVPQQCQPQQVQCQPQQMQCQQQVPQQCQLQQVQCQPQQAAVQDTCAPCNPCSPCGPFGPCANFSPFSTSAPCGPCAPCGPGTPCATPEPCAGPSSYAQQCQPCYPEFPSFAQPNAYSTQCGQPTSRGDCTNEIGNGYVECLGSASAPSAPPMPCTPCAPCGPCAPCAPCVERPTSSLRCLPSPCPRDDETSTVCCPATTRANYNVCWQCTEPSECTRPAYMLLGGQLYTEVDCHRRNGIQDLCRMCGNWG